MYYGIRGGSATFVSIFICFCILISVFISVCIFLFVAFPFYGTLCVAMRFVVSVLNIFPFRLSLRISTFVFILNFGFHFDFFVKSKSRWKSKYSLYMEAYLYDTLLIVSLRTGDGWNVGRVTMNVAVDEVVFFLRDLLKKNKTNKVILMYLNAKCGLQWR